MPVKPPIFRPGLTVKQQAQRYDRNRGSPSKRGYGRQWQSARLAYLAVHPLCVACERDGLLEPAAEVDHIVPHGGNPGLFWDQANWQSLCRSHHAQKTRAENPP